LLTNVSLATCVKSIQVANLGKIHKLYLYSTTIMAWSESSQGAAACIDEASAEN